MPKAAVVRVVDLNPGNHFAINHRVPTPRGGGVLLLDHETPYRVLDVRPTTNGVTVLYTLDLGVGSWPRLIAYPGDAEVACRK